MTPGTCPAFYPIGYNGVLHRTEPELNAFVKRYLGPEIWWLKYRSEALARHGERYQILVSAEKNPKPKYSDSSGQFRGNLGLMLTSEAKPGQWVYPLTIIFNGGREGRKPKSLIEIPIDTGLDHTHFPVLVHAAIGTKKYLTARRSQRVQIADFVGRLFDDN